MSIPEIRKSFPKRHNFVLFLGLLVLTLLTTLVLAPLYYYTSFVDVLFSNTILPLVLDLLIDLCEIAIYLFAYPIIIYAVFRFGMRGATPTLMIFLGTTALRYLLNLVMSWVQLEAVALEDIPYSLLYLAMEVGQLALVCLFSALTTRRFHREGAVLEKANRVLGKPMPTDRERVHPFPTLLSRQNPLQASALYTGILLIFTRVSTRILYDVLYGAPTSLSDLIWMIVYYLSDLLVGVLFYASALFLFDLLFKKEEKK